MEFLAHLIISLITHGFVFGMGYYLAFRRMSSPFQIGIKELQSKINYVNKLSRVNFELQEDLQEAIKYHYQREQ
jgi:hypothetical protein